MISCYFGCPGCGKTSVLARIVQKEQKRIAKGKSKYKAIYTNFPCRGAYKIDYSQFGKFYYHDCLIVLDELTLSADSRDWKKITQEAKSFICLHRHFNIDIIVSVQDYSRCEKTIRENVVNLYYLDRFLGVVMARPVYRTIAINEYIGDLILGYRFPTVIEMLTGSHLYWVRRAWKMFDTHDKYGFDQKPVAIDKVWFS